MARAKPPFFPPKGHGKKVVKIMKGAMESTPCVRDAAFASSKAWP